MPPDPRTRFVGAALPTNARAYKHTPTFTNKSVPQALTREHATKAGVWAVVEVTSGQLRYCEPEYGIDAVLDETIVAVAGPEMVHRVTPIGEVAFFVTFWRVADDD